MARDLKLSFRFGTGVLGASAGNVQMPGTNITSYATSFGGLTGTAASTTNAVSNQLISCPLAWGGFSQTANPVGPSYAEDVPNGGVVLPGHSSRNDLVGIVDVIVATALTTAQTFVIQASDDSTNWVTIGTADVTVPGTNPSNGTVALTIAAGTFNVLTASAAHGLQPGDLLVVSAVTTCNFSNGHESVLGVAGNVVEVNTVPSTTTFTIKYPGIAGTTLKSNALVLNTLQVVASGTPALTFTKCVTSGASVGAQLMIPLAPTVKPYVRLAAFGGASASGFAVIRDAYIALARTGVAR
jgi:hypothetical protein